jgi:predicted cupin superfamily sugar epimerase
VIEPDDLIDRFGLVPLPVEGGFFRQYWRSSAGTAILFLLTDTPDGFSQFHRLDADEIWHAYLGDPIELVLLEPGGTSRHVVLGPDVLAGHDVVAVVPAGTWMAARTTGRWSLAGTTMAPGYTDERYEDGERDALLAGWPQEAAAIRALTRPDEPKDDGSVRAPAT